jgi:hypothetical protein
LIYRLGLLAGDPLTPTRTLVAIARIVAAADRSDLSLLQLQLQRRLAEPAQTAAEARDAWSDIAAALDAESSPGATPGPAGTVPTPDPGP